MATPGIYKNFEAEGEIGPYVIVTHGTADYAVKAATGATVALVGTTDELGKLSNGRVDVCTGGIPEVALGGTVAAGDPLTSDASGKALVSYQPIDISNSCPELPATSSPISTASARSP